MYIYNINQSRTNTPFPLIFVDLKPSANNKDTYLTETLHWTKVKFETPRPNQTIPQCSKCQSYGHTKTYYFHSPRCVKCAGTHFTSQCLWKDKSDVTCVLHNGNHPANYKVCTVYKDLKTFPPLRRNQEGKHSHALPHPHILLPPPTLLLSNLHWLQLWLLTLNPNNKTRIGNSRIHHKPIFKNWKYCWKYSWSKWAPS
jgi:hypothetical protein